MTLPVCHRIARRPPFFADFPFKLDGDAMVSDRPAYDAWEASFPANMAPRFKDNLLRLRGIRFDSGFDDEFTHVPPTAPALSRRLTELGVAHIFEAYNGDHRNRMWGERGRLYNEVLPWFSLLLEAE